MPENVGVIALTATVTKETLKIIEERLSLKDSVVIGLPPTQPNIVYKVQKLLKPDEFCEILSCDLLQKRQNYPKTIIFCHSYSYCADLYKSMRIKMGSSFTEPCGYPDLHQFRLLDMYTRASTRRMNEKVLTSF